jgi:hypothetical protein
LAIELNSRCATLAELPTGRHLLYKHLVEASHG